MRRTAITLVAVLHGCAAAPIAPESELAGAATTASAAARAPSVAPRLSAPTRAPTPTPSTVAPYARAARAGAQRPGGNRVLEVDWDTIPVAGSSEAPGRAVHVSIEGGGSGPLGVAIDRPLFAEIALPNGRVYTRGQFQTLDAEPCRPSARPLVRAFAVRTRRWTAETAEVAWLTGNLDAGACSVSLTEESSAQAIAIAPGMAYAVREPRTSSATPERMWIVMPSPVYLATAPTSTEAFAGPISRVALPVAEGTSAAMIATFTQRTLEAWWLRHDGSDLVDTTPAALSLTVEVAWPRRAAHPAIVATIAPLQDAANRMADAMTDPSHLSEAP